MAYGEAGQDGQGVRALGGHAPAPDAGLLCNYSVIALRASDGAPSQPQDLGGSLQIGNRDGAISQLGAIDVSLDDTVLKRIDEIVMPGMNFSWDDAGWRPPWL